MAEVILYVAASLDGCIATHDGEVKWLEDKDFLEEGNDFGYAAFYASIGYTLMGNITYQQVLGFDAPFPYPDKTNYVFSRSQKGSDEHVEYINESPDVFVRRLKNSAEKDIWLVGGGKVNTELMKAGLVDKIILALMPVCLGNGIPLFNPDSFQQKFNLENCERHSTGVLMLTYSKKD